MAADSPGWRRSDERRPPHRVHGKEDAERRCSFREGAVKATFTAPSRSAVYARRMRSRLPRIRRPMAVAKARTDSRPDAQLALIAFSLIVVWLGMRVIDIVARAHGVPL